MTAIENPVTPRAILDRPQTTLSTSILYADDDSSLRDLVPRVLFNAGYQVDTAADGEAAWAALQARSYDLLITDNQMPHLTGTELIRKVRLASINVPVILVSGTLDGLSLDELPWLECGTTLAKPFTHVELLSVIRAVLRATASAPRPSGVRLPGLEKFNIRVESYRGWGINE